MISGFSRLRQAQKFIIIPNSKNVEINFGKYKGETFRSVSKEDPEYLQFILDIYEDRMSREVRLRLHHWLNKSLSFWI